MSGRVLFDGRGLLGRTTGMGRYATELCRAASRSSTISFAALCLSDDPASPELTVRRASTPPRVPVMNPWQHIGVPIDIWRAHASIYHYPGIDIPIIARGAVVATCPDLEPIRAPGLFTRKIVLYYRAFARRLRRADIVIAISATTAADVSDIAGVPPARIRVVPLGAGAAFHPNRSGTEDARSLRKRYGLPDRYFLYIGNTMPHKNVAGIVRAFSQLPPRGEMPGLVIAGRPDGYRSGLRDLAQTLGVPGRVRFVDYIQEADLPELYRSSLALVFPSFYEGFGLPVLEAMACGTPVITSNTGSLAEMTDGVAAQVDPADTTAITAAMAMVDRDDPVVATMRSMGVVRASAYSWDDFARAHLSVYEDLS